MELGVCTAIDNAAALHAAGFDYVEVNCQGFLKPQEGDEAFAASRDAAAAAALPPRTANCFLPGSLRSTGSEVDRGAIVAYAEIAFARAAAVGCQTIVFGSGGSRKLPEGYDYDLATTQFTEVCRDLGPVAARHGVTLALEPLNSGECNFLTSVPEGAAIVRAVDHPNIRLLADFYHMLRDGQGPEDLEGNVDLLAHAHLAEKTGRTPPGTDGDDFRPYLAKLLEGGYQGRLSIEGKWDDLAAQAGPALQELRRQIDEVAAAGSR